MLNRLLAAAGAEPVPTEEAPEGAQLKVNMLLQRLPRLRDPAADPAAAFAGTFHINEGYSSCRTRMPPLPPATCRASRRARSTATASRTARSSAPSSRDSDAQTLTLFGLHMPARLFREDHDAMRDLALSHTLESLNSVLAEPIQDVADARRDGRLLPRGEDARRARDATSGCPGATSSTARCSGPGPRAPREVGTWGVETPHAQVLLAGAGARRGGGVCGIPGHNAAQAVLQELSRPADSAGRVTRAKQN